MKKYLLIAVCAVMALSASAQRARSSSTSTFFSSERSDAPITFGITTGLNIANMTFDQDGLSISPDSRTAFNIGLTVDVPLLESIYIKSGLFYTGKGCKFEDKYGDVVYSPAYLEIPILASYRYDFSEAAQMQLNFGPYLAYGIGGKAKDDDDEEDFFGSDSDTNRFDAGLQIGAGITVNQHYYFGVAYQWGLTNVMSNNHDKSNDGLTIHNKNFMINVGYTF